MITKLHQALPFEKSKPNAFPRPLQARNYPNQDIFDLSIPTVDDPSSRFHTIGDSRIKNTREDESCVDPLETALDKFRRIGLPGMSQVSLMNRIDSKYWFHASVLPEILSQIADNYSLLQIKGASIQWYETFYYDTPEDAFYLDHQNERSNRLKIRKREYVQSNLRFLEIKRKSRDGRTKKSRIEIGGWDPSLPPSERRFLDQHIEGIPAGLTEVIRNRFKRITFANRNLQERCTIDFDLEFMRQGKTTALANIVVLELKQGNRRTPSRLREVLHENHLHARGFSKYCIGRALMQPELKHNRLKPSLLRIQQLENN